MSPNTLLRYDAMVRLGVEALRHYRALVASRETRGGAPLQDRSVLDSHKALLTFFRWAADEDYRVDARLLSLKRRKVAAKEATVCHVRELHQILAACNSRFPVEDLVVRLLVGSGVRASELCGLALVAPDGCRTSWRTRWIAAASSCACGGTVVRKVESRD